MKLTKIAAIFFAATVALSPTMSIAKTSNHSSVKSEVIHTQRNLASKKVTSKAVVKVKQIQRASKHIAVKSAKKVETKKITVSHTKENYQKKMKSKIVVKPTQNVERKAHSTGIASFYANKFNGRRTANGEIFNNNAFTAAHRTLPIGTHIEVTNLRNGRTVVVRVNDRGPYVAGRALDLSRAAAAKLGMVSSGSAKVKIVVLGKKPQIEPRKDEQAVKNEKISPTKGHLVVMGFVSPKPAEKLKDSISQEAQIKKVASGYNLVINVQNKQELAKLKRRMASEGYQILSYSEQ